ncbi:N-methylhydantoinase A/acetone carboxylase, beta subunit [Pseudomonas sp. GM49]|uniref:hydantoinase/oxoprolinase family protein n=1 Tax=Pseudomonas sp. GM49 TaxID=1144331 RepID=UPI0002702800|nr:hydantoinase/oxoprolinase family protein [Pseudomonas sp. GM49]EJM53592.1 N-methylhydantoinase A/acetone carboxylase, beta subunit [Pseudomonas sp. GM49]
MYRIGIDVGGTFTDFTMINEDNGKVEYHKVPSTPHDPSEAIENGISDLLRNHKVSADQVSHIGHGTTVATNLIIERKGASLGLITTRGFRDVMEIGRQIRPSLCDYNVGKPPSLVKRMHRVEVGERLDAQGMVVESLDEEAVRQAATMFAKESLEAVAICFLHSYRNPVHEQRAKAIVQEILPSTYISISSEVLPEFREYERLSTTALNASVGPRMARYLDRFLERASAMGVVGQPLTVHSNGGLMSPDAVREFPVRTCLSGPAAGVVGAAAVGRHIGQPNLVTFDVGGTSTDVSLISGGKPLFTSSRQVAGYPVKTPMVDIHVIGAGGGSIAWLDDAGSLKVGPHSAGAVPGPVGYARGGTEPTITDAEIVLQRLNPEVLLKGRMRVDAAAARKVIEDKVAKPLGLSLEDAAEGILRIANANMSRAIRAVSTEKGHNLAEFALYAYGGAGGLHAMDVAEECGISTVVVPREPGTMCARGILLTDISFDFVRSAITTASAQNWKGIVELFNQLKGNATKWLDQEHVNTEMRQLVCAIDARYNGQNFEVLVPMDTVGPDDLGSFEAAFHVAHEREYGYQVEGRAIQIINCRVQAVGRVLKAPLAAARADTTLADAKVGQRQVYAGKAYGWCETPIFDRDLLSVGIVVEGPAIIEEMSSTTVLGPNHEALVDPHGNLIVTLHLGAQA